MSQTIYLQTGNPSKNWLAYLIMTFQGIHPCSIKVIDLHAPVPAKSPKILYAPKITTGFRGVFIPELPIDDQTPEVSISFRGTLSRGSKIANHEIRIHHQVEYPLKSDGVEILSQAIIFQFDLLKNAFIRLSCAAERRFEKGLTKSIPEKQSYRKPIVDYLFFLLYLALEQTSPPLRSEDYKSQNGLLPMIPTHDVDAVEKGVLKSAKQASMNFYNAGRLLRQRRYREAIRRLSKTGGLLVGRDDFNQFDYWSSIEDDPRLKPIYHLYVRQPNRGLRNKFQQWIYDPTYRIEERTDLRDYFRRLARSEITLGLHGSFASYNQPDLLTSEKGLLENLVNHPCDYIRQHWLRFSFKSTWQAQEEAGFKYETGFGFNHQIGFRSWFAHPHHPWDEKNERSHRIKVIPMVAMDSTLYDYQLLTEQEIFPALQGLLEETTRFQGQVNINWHSHSASRHFNWHPPYARLLRAIV